MRLTKTLYSVALLFSAFGVSKLAIADPLVFSLGQTAIPVNFSANTGIAQGVYVDTTTVVNDFSFYLKENAGANLRYFIWDATSASMVLAPEAVPGLVPAGTKDWIELSGISVVLNAGSEYYFGVIGQGQFQIGLDPNPIPYTAIGLELPTSGASAYDFSNYANPTIGAADQYSAGLRVYDSPVSATPEPSSLALLGTGILGAAGAMRRRFVAQ